MSYRNLLDEVKKGLPSPCYMLTSSDRFLHSEAVSLIRGMIPESELDFSFQSFDLLSSDQDKPSPDLIIDVLNTVPFFSGRKYVVVENFQKLPKKEMGKFAGYLTAPSESSILVLLYEGSPKKDFKEGLKGAKQISLDIRESDMPSWLVDKARSKDLSLTDEAARYLLAIIGPDLGMLSTEVEKLTLIGKKDVSLDDIKEIVEGKRAYGVFDLINALRNRNADEAFRIYGILRETEEPYILIGALNWQYAQMQGEGNSPAEQNYLYEVFSLLKNADAGIKTGSYYPLELLLAKLLKLSPKR